METLQELFRNHVPGDRIFDPSKVVIEGEPGQNKRRDWPPTIEARYKHEGVEIWYYSRVTWHLGDFDRFDDYSGWGSKDPGVLPIM